jgi:hypothetical protein
MVLASEGSSEIERMRVKRLLSDLLKPVKVKDITITSSNRYALHGRVRSYCPIEKTESWKDFDVSLEEGDPSKVGRVIVDAKKLFPRPKGWAKKHAG